MQANNELGYEGYCIDLLLELSKLLRFNFTIFTVSDGTYGIEVRFLPNLISSIISFMAVVYVKFFTLLILMVH